MDPTNCGPDGFLATSSGGGIDHQTVRDRIPVEIGEGFTEHGRVPFPEDSTRRAYVYWRDTTHLALPARVLIMEVGTRWRLPLGLTIGTIMAELERLNGRPFVFGGLDWDCGVE